MDARHFFQKFQHIVDWENNMCPEAQEQVDKTFAPGLFNKTWEYMTRESLTAEEEDEMLHIAHASRYHWSKIGKPVNLARGEWLLARAYSVAKRPTEALYWANRCRERCEGMGLSAFDCAASAEAVARAHAVGGNTTQAREWRDKAAESAKAITEAEDKKIFDEDLASLDAMLG